METNALSDLFQNKLFLQYLSGAGAAIGSGKNIAEGLNPITQQNISSQNYMKLLKKMLEGNIPDGGKMTMDKDGLSMKIPSSALNLEGGGVASENREYLSRAKGTFINPSSSPLDVSSADLAGLTTRDISQALSGALGIKEIEQKKVSSEREFEWRALVDIWKATEDRRKAALEERRVKVAESAEERLLSGVPKKVSVTLPDKRVVDVNPKDALTYYAKKYDLPLSYDTYRIAQKDPKYKAHLIEMAQAGATQINLGDVAEKEIAKGAGKGVADVTSPDFVQTVREGLGKDKMTWYNPPKFAEYLKKGYDETKATEMAQRHAVISEMDARIRQAFKGKTVERKVDGWYVDGKLEVRMP